MDSITAAADTGTLLLRALLLGLATVEPVKPGRQCGRLIIGCQHILLNPNGTNLLSENTRDDLVRTLIENAQQQ